jgi:hypothetical protein
MKVQIREKIHDIDNDRAKLVLMYKGHGMECEKVNLLDEHVVVDCGRTLEYAYKHVDSDEHMAIFRKSSLHRKCFDLIWNNERGTNLGLEPPEDLGSFKSEGSGMQHSIVLIFLMVNAFAVAHATGKKVYLVNHPESHLHPGIQANLADLLIKFSVTGFSTKQDEFSF